MQLKLTEEQKLRNQRIGKFIGDVSYFGFLAILLIGFTMFFISGKKTGKPNVLGYRHFYIVSGSMEPTIMTQQFVMAKVINADEVEENDIIAYKDRNSKDIIIHRVVNIKEGEDGKRVFEFKGDNNPSSDPYDITENMIMYKVIWY